MNSDNQLIFKDERDTNALALSSAIVVILIAAVCYILPPYIKIIKNGDFPDVFTQRFLFLVIALIGIPSFLYSLFKPRLPLTVDQENINYNNQTIAFKNIKHINTHLLAGATKAYQGEEAVEINLKNGGSVIIKIGAYGNGALFRTVCDKIMSNQAQGIYKLDEAPATEDVAIDVTINDKPEVLADTGKFETFLGNPTRSFSFWLTIFIFGAGLFTFLQNIPFANRLLYLGGAIALGFFTASNLNYFLVSQDYLIVRHHFYFWKKVIIPMKNIKRMSSSFTGKSGYAIELLTSDYKTHYYYTDKMFKSSLNDLIDKVNGYVNK